MPWRITHRDDHPIGVKAFKQAAAGIPTPHQEFRLMHKSGEYRWAAGSSFPVYDDDGVIRSVQVIIEDITVGKRLEEQLRHSQKMEAVGQLSAGIAHNFNNMLQGIQGCLDLAREEPAEAARAYLEDAAAMTKRAAAIVRQLVLSARPDSDPHQIPVDISAVIANVNQICSTTFERSTEIQTSIADQLPSVVGDSTQIEQVLLNLCLNARDALSEAGHAAPAIEIFADSCSVPEQRPFPPPGSEAGVCVRLQVRDEGTGMTPKVRGRVFEPFFSTREPGKGTGLGLSTAYGIVQQHGGWIDCESEPGVGTTFSVYLPAGTSLDQDADRPSQTTRQAEGGSEAIRIGSQTILVEL